MRPSPEGETQRMAWKRLSIYALFLMQPVGTDYPYSMSLSTRYMISEISLTVSICVSSKAAITPSLSFSPIALLNKSKPLPLTVLGSSAMTFLGQQSCLRQQMSSPMQTQLLIVSTSMARTSRTAICIPLRLPSADDSEGLLLILCMMPAKACNFFSSSRYISNNFSCSISKEPAMSYSCLGSAVKCMFSKAAITSPACGVKRDRLRI